MTYLGPSLRRSRKRAARPWVRAGAAVAASLLVNALVLREVKVGFLTPRPVTAPRAIQLAPLSASEWEANRRASSARAASPDRTAPPLAVLRPPTPPPVPPLAPGQVVDVAPSKDSTPPKDSRFVSDRNNTVAKETRSRSAKAGFPNVAAVPTNPNAAPPAEARERAVAAGEGGREGAAKPGERKGAERRGGGEPRLPEQPAHDKLALAPSRDGELRLTPPRPEVRGGGAQEELPPGAPQEGKDGEGEAARAGRPGPLASLSLHPSAATYDRLVGGPAPDHLEGIEEGDGTYLNTREWKYASYFNRIKQAVATQWNPNDALRLRDPTGQRFAYKQRVTVVAVHLNETGALKDISVERSSGVDFLDTVAVEAFRKAQPFVNPPSGLAQNGEIAFSFGFYIEVGSGLHIFRGPGAP